MAAKHGPEFFDDPSVFEFYRMRRANPENANDTLERPVLADLIGEVQGLRILDLGCGDAGLGLQALDAGCKFYVGIDGPRNMVRLAQQALAGRNGLVHQSRIEEWSFPQEQFDLVISSLALHYPKEVNDIFRSVFGTLCPGGRFVFSVEHPVLTSCDRAREKGGMRQAWIVDDYFETGERITHWLGANVIKYHRTIEDYFCGLREAGFLIDAVRESRPRPEMFSDEATFQRRKRIPLMLFFSAYRPDDGKK